MPVAAILALVNGVIAGAPEAIAAFNQLKAMVDKDPAATVTKEQLQASLADARTAHEAVQNS